MRRFFSPALTLLATVLAAAFLVAVPTGPQASATPAPSPLLASGAAGWGSDSYNQATGQGYKAAIPLRASRGEIPAAAEITHLVSSQDHACAIADGKAYCWGSRALGTTSMGRDESPFPVAVDTTGVLLDKVIVDLTLAANVACALTLDNVVACWGANYNGELGDGTTTGSAVPVAVVQTGAMNGKTIKELGSARSTLCALDTTGQAYCWGSNFDGTVGNDSGTDTSVAVTVDQRNVSGTGFASLGSGIDSMCGISTEGDVFCWGRGWKGQVGDGTTSEVRRVPVAVTQNAALGSDAVDVRGGRYFNCALRSNGEAACWGWNNYGQLGTGSAGADSTVPVAVADFPGRAGRDIEQIQPGDSSTCLMLADHDVYCWGYADYGMLGNGTFTPDLTVPDPIVDSPQGLRGEQLASLAGMDSTMCGLGVDGEIYCWGNAAGGSLGTGGSEYNRYPTPMLSLGLDPEETWRKFAPGNDFTCALSSRELVYCWGYGGYGVIGDGDSSDSYLPKLVEGALVGKSVVDVAAGAYHACALTDVGEVFCWGTGGTGALGNGDTNDEFLPVQALLADVVPAGRAVTAIRAGYESTCALDDAGSIYCWGANGYGQLGVGDFDDRDAPTLVLAPSGVIFSAMDTDFYETCALDAVGNAYCWGRNEYGSLGNGVLASDSIPTPTAVTMTPLAGQAFDAIDVGESQVCALANGAAWCWGTNGNGQLGNGTTADSAVPVAVDVTGALSGKTVADIAVGYYTTCAVDSDGGAYCWGENSNGQNGNGTSDENIVPTPVVLVRTLLEGSRFATIEVGGENTAVLATLVPANRVPDAPANPSVISRSRGRAMISWTAPADGGSPVTDFVVEVARDSAGPWATPGGCRAVSVATACLARGISVRADYYVRVAAVNDNGQSAWARTRLIREPSVAIEVRRADDPAFIRVSGDAVGLLRRPVVVHVLAAGWDSFRTYEAGRVNAGGRFAYALEMPRRAVVYVTVDSVRSNNVTISRPK